MSAECLVFDTIVHHPKVTLWKVLGEPELYPRFFRGVSWCEQAGQGSRGTRYRLRVAFSDEVLEHQLETMINRPPEQLVFSSVPDTGGWVSIRLSDAGPGRTEVKFVFFKPSLPHPRWELWSDAAIRAWARDGLARISDHLARVPSPLPDRREAMASQWQVARTLISAGGSRRPVRTRRSGSCWRSPSGAARSPAATPRPPPGRRVSLP
jgi:hypothetical protein